jgi:aspartyl-tRNA(Asn)/glutamyl-tRNA(Gln) amidotransferase subunit B
MAELPDTRRERFLRDFGITPYDADVLTASRGLADYFEATVKAGANAKLAANWIQTEVLRRMKASGPEAELEPEFRPSPKELASLLRGIESGQISTAMAKKIFPQMFDSAKSAAEIIAAEGLAQISDTGEIERICREVLARNPDNVAKYKSGNEGVFKFFVGQVMKASRGQANPQAVNDILKRLLA